MTLPNARSLAVRAAIAGAVLLAAAVPIAGPACAARLTLPLPDPLPPVRALTVLTGIHILGVCFGLGGATMLDFWILRWLRWGDLPGEIARIFGFVSKVCSAGLAILWLSGLGFLALYAAEAPDKLANPKLWAKVTVVVVLSLNGAVIGSVVLPHVLRDMSRPILHGISIPRAVVFLVSGSISGVSWYTAFALGLMRELNGTVAYGLLIVLWLTGIAATSLAAILLWMRLRRRTAGERWGDTQLTLVDRASAPERF